MEQGRAVLTQERDRILIIAEILRLCRGPQTIGCIRSITGIPQKSLRKYIHQLLTHEWLETVEDDCQHKKVETTIMGLIFLEKFSEIERLIGLKNDSGYIIASKELQVLSMQ